MSNQDNMDRVRLGGSEGLGVSKCGMGADEHHRSRLAAPESREVVPMNRVALATTAFVLVLLSGCAPSVQAPATEPGETITTSRFIREDLRFPCGETTCAGWLYSPTAVGKPPVVVMAHGLTGIRQIALPEFAEAFAANGIAAFVFDYRYFGDSGGSPRNLADPLQQLDDWRAAIAHVRALDQVDADRLAVWGTSFSGGLVLKTAAEDPNIDAIVAQIPAVDTETEAPGFETDLGFVARIFLAIVLDNLKSIISDEAFEIPTFGAPGDFAMFRDAQTMKDLEPMRREDLPRRKVAGRSFTRFGDYDPRTAWDHIQVPTLIVASETDRLSPFAPIAEFAELQKQHVTLAVFEGNHFSVYQQPVLDWAKQRQAEFLLEVLADQYSP